MSSVEEQVDAYRASHERIAALVRKLNGEQLATVVTCCPLWSVKDLVGHLTGVLEDRRSGNMPTGTFDEWTAAQVARHRDEPIEAVLDTWTEVLSVSAEGPPSMAALSFDAVTHEFDLYQALGVAGDRSSASVRVGAERALGRLSSMLVEGNAPSVQITTEDCTNVAEGRGETITLDTSRYALMRMTTGRMSRAQVEALGWGSDPALVLDALYADGFFVLQPADVVEVDGF
ncbi:MAG: maleylpyruvate isomerase family mycothiol-dependent enzyme [Acidimicrobiales bacterium]